MRNHNKVFLLLIILFCCYLGYSQSTSGTNTVITPNTPNTPGVDYLGWASTVGVPLEIKHEAALPIRFYTNASAGGFNNLRMTIFGGATQTRGEVAIHLNPATPITAPVSMLHIGEATNAGARTWMNVGTTYTEEIDLMYVGIKNEGTDKGNAVIT